MKQIFIFRKNKLQYFGLASLLVIACFASSCDPEQKIPGYIYIPKLRLETINNGTKQEGTDSARLIDAWIYSNDSIVSGLRLPGSTPIIAIGDTKITVLPGVAENGNYALLATYPFLDRFEVTLPNRPGKIDTLKPVFHYNNLTEFKFIESFTNAAPVFLKQTDSDTTINQSSEAPFSAPSCGKIALDDAHSFCRVISGAYPFNNSTQSQCWLELSYRNNNAFSVGVVTVKNGVEKYNTQEKIGVSPRANWNRIYINLTQEVKNAGSDHIRIVITARKEGGVTNPYIYLDDLKLLVL